MDKKQMLEILENDLEKQIDYMAKLEADAEALAKEIFRTKLVIAALKQAIEESK